MIYPIYDRPGAALARARGHAGRTVQPRLSYTAAWLGGEVRGKDFDMACCDHVHIEVKVQTSLRACPPVFYTAL